MTRINRVLAMYQEQLYFSLQAVLTKTLLFASDKNLLLSLGERRDVIGMYWGILCDTRKDRTSNFWKDRGTARVRASLNQGFQHKQQLVPCLPPLLLLAVPAWGEEYGHRQLLNFSSLSCHALGRTGLCAL